MLTIAEILAHSLHFPRRRVGLAQQRLDHPRQKITTRVVAVARAGRLFRFWLGVSISAHYLQRLGERVEGGADVSWDGDRMRAVVGGRGDLGQSCEEGGEIGATASRWLGGC